MEGDGPSSVLACALAFLRRGALELKVLVEMRGLCGVVVGGERLALVVSVGSLGTGSREAPYSRIGGAIGRVLVDRKH